MRKKLLIIVFVTGCLDLLVLACCPGPYYGFLSIESITLSSEIFEEPIKDETTSTYKEFALFCGFKTSTIAQGGFGLGHMPLAYATTCPENGEQGLKVQIKSVQVTASNEVMDITAGQPLNVNDNILVFERRDELNDEDKAIPFAEWLSMLNDDFFYLGHFGILKFQKEFSIEETITFRIEFFFEDGTKLDAETPPIVP